MEAVIITKEDVQEIVQAVQITFIVNCIIVIFIFILNSNVDVLTQFLASQSIGLTIVTIIQTAKVLHPPFKTDYKKLYYFLPVPVLPASLIGINFLHDQTSLPELIILVAIISMPVMLLFQYKDKKINFSYYKRKSIPISCLIPWLISNNISPVTPKKRNTC